MNARRAVNLTSPSGIDTGDHDNEFSVDDAAMKTRGRIESICTASGLMQPRSPALLVEQENQ